MSLNNTPEEAQENEKSGKASPYYFNPEIYNDLSASQKRRKINSMSIIMISLQHMYLHYQLQKIIKELIMTLINLKIKVMIIIIKEDIN